MNKSDSNVAMSAATEDEKREIAAIMVGLYMSLDDNAEAMGWGLDDTAYGTHTEAEKQAEVDRYNRISDMIPEDVKESLRTGDDSLIEFLATHLDEFNEFVAKR